MDGQQLYSQAILFHRQGNLLQAEQLYAQLLTAAPASFPALHMLGVLRAQQGRNQEALDLIGAALKVQPGAVTALVNHGNLLSKLRRFQEALASYDRALAAEPGNLTVIAHRAEALLGLSRFGEALSGFDLVLAAQPNNAQAGTSVGPTASGTQPRGCSVSRPMATGSRCSPTSLRRLPNGSLSSLELGAFLKGLFPNRACSSFPRSEPSPAPG